MPNTTDDPPDPATASNYFMDRLWYDNQRRVENDFNVTFENIITPWGYEISNLTASVMAGDPFAELVMTPTPHLLPAILGNLAMPASQFASPTSDLLTNNLFVEQRAVLGGEVYGFGRADLRTQSTGLGINLEIIHASGAPNPVDLWESGQWTWDAMREVMAITTQDTTGDGQHDQFGLSGDIGSLLRMMVATNDGMLIDEETLTFAMEDPRTITAIEFLGDIFDNRWWQYDSASGAPLGDWNRNNWIYQEGNSAMFPLATWMVAEQGVGFDFAIVPFPAGPSSAGHHNMTGFYQALFIPMGTDNPEDVYFLYEEIQSWARHEPSLFNEGTEMAMRQYWPTEGDVYRVLHVLGDISTSKFDVGFIIAEFYWVFGTFANYQWFGGQTPMQVVESERPFRQEMIDLAFDGF